MLQNPTGGTYSAPPDPAADEGSLPLPRTPLPLSALRSSFLRVSGSNPLQSWQLMIDFKCIGQYKVRIFLVSENGENGLGDEGADGGNAPSIFGLEPPLDPLRFFVAVSQTKHFR